MTLNFISKELSKRHRRITGARTCNRYIIRHGTTIIFVENAINDPSTLQRILTVDYQAYKQEVSNWKARTSEYKRRFRFNKNPDEFLEKIENQWLNS